MKPSKYIEGDLIFIFLDYLRTAWDEDYRLINRARIKQVLLKLRSLGIDRINPFAYLADGKADHKYLNPKTPWKCKEKNGRYKYNTKKWQKRYFFLLKDFDKICKETEQHPQWQLYPYGYGFEPFRSNKQSIKDFWDLNALKYQKKFGRRVLRITKRILDNPDFATVVTLMNEPRNQWKNAHNEVQKQLRHMMAHILADWHYEMFEFLKKKKLTNINHLYVDIHLAERPVSHLVTHMEKNAKCEVCGEYWHNWNNPEYGRKLMPVKHSVSIKEDRPDQAETFLHSWKHLKTSEDGSHNPKCRGPKFEGSHFRVGDADQVHELLIHDFSIAKEIGAVRIHGLFPMGTSVWTPDERGLQQAYSVDKIDWTRFDAAGGAEREIWG